MGRARGSRKQTSRKQSSSNNDLRSVLRIAKSRLLPYLSKEKVPFQGLQPMVEEPANQGFFGSYKEIDKVQAVIDACSGCIWYYMSSGVNPNIVKRYFIILILNGTLCPVAFYQQTGQVNHDKDLVQFYRLHYGQFSNFVQHISDENDGASTNLYALVNANEIVKAYRWYKDTTFTSNDLIGDMAQRLYSAYGSIVQDIKLTFKQIYRHYKSVGLIKPGSQFAQEMPFVDEAWANQQHKQQQKTSWFEEGFAGNQGFHMEYWDTLAFYVPNGCVIKYEYSRQLRSRGLLCCENVLFGYEQSFGKTFQGHLVVFPMRYAVAFGQEIQKEPKWLPVGHAAQVLRGMETQVQEVLPDSAAKKAINGVLNAQYPHLSWPNFAQGIFQAKTFGFYKKLAQANEMAFSNSYYQAEKRYARSAEIATYYAVLSAARLPQPYDTRQAVNPTNPPSGGGGSDGGMYI